MPDPNTGLPPRYLRTPEAARFLSLSAGTVLPAKRHAAGLRPYAGQVRR